jgi:rRNA-processing protein FCF1
MKDEIEERVTCAARNLAMDSSHIPLIKNVIMKELEGLAEKYGNATRSNSDRDDNLGEHVTSCPAWF